MIETGYRWEGTTCTEAIRPTAVISSVSKENTLTVSFSEEVYITDLDLFNESLKAYIKGPETPYSFNYSLYDPNGLTKDSRLFTSFKIKITNVKTSFAGGGIEKIDLWLTNSSLIKDQYENELSDGKYSANLNYYEYVSNVEKSNAESGGNSMKYTLITMFSLNMVLKLIISTSSALMWSLVHVLQVFRYILMINIDAPEVMDILMKYLAVVVGEIEELEDLVPDWFTQYIVDTSDLEINITLYPRFQEYGYESPFIAILFSKQMTLIFGGFIVSFPIIFIGTKLFSKCEGLKKMFTEVWDGFWWNGPLRTFTELYIEI